MNINICSIKFRSLQILLLIKMFFPNKSRKNRRKMPGLVTLALIGGMPCTYAMYAMYMYICHVCHVHVHMPPSSCTPPSLEADAVYILYRPLYHRTSRCTGVSANREGSSPPTAPTPQNVSSQDYNLYYRLLSICCS